MNKLLLKIFVLILIYNNLHSITCDDIMEKINELDKYSQKVLVINYSTEKIIILKGTTNYLAYIGNINAVVNYIQCSEIYDNSLLFNNIEDKSVVYSLQLSKGIKDLTLEVKFNTIDHITDENKLEIIHNIFSKSNTQKYITSPHEIERLFDAHHNDYNLGFSNHQEYNILADVSSEHSKFDSSGKVPYHLLDDKELSDNISTDLLDENNITGYSDFPHADVTTENIESTNAVDISVNPRSIKRKLEKEGESGAKRQELSNTHEEKDSADLEELRFGALPEKLKDFIVENGEFKDQFDILYLIYPAEKIPLNKFIINEHMNKLIEQLKSGENLILLNKELAMDQIKNKKSSTLKTIFIVIKKIDDIDYNIYTFQIKRYNNEIVPSVKALMKNIYFANRTYYKKHVEFSLLYNGFHIKADDFYIIGSLSIKDKVEKMRGQLQGQSSTHNAVKESTVLQKEHSLKDVVFGGHSNSDLSGKVPPHFLDKNDITDYSDFPHADVTTENIESTNAVDISVNPRSIKRKLEKEGESGAKRQELSNTHEEKVSADLEELRFGALPEKLKDFILKNGEFKDQFDILYLIYPAEKIPLNKFIINEHMNKLIEQLKSGENLILLNKELAMDQIENTKHSNLRIIFIVIKKIDDIDYNIYTFSINKYNNNIDTSVEALGKKISFANRRFNQHVEFSLVYTGVHIKVDGFYIIGSLSIKDKVEKMSSQLQGQSSTDNAVKESTVLQKEHSLKDILDTEFTGNNYYIDEEYNKLLLLESRVKYLKDNIIKSNRENLFVLIQKQFSVNGENKLNTQVDKKVGIILKKKYLTGINDTSFKVEFIRQGSSASIYFIENTDISGKVNFYIDNKSLKLYNRHNEKRNRLNLNNYYLIRELL